MTAPAVAPLVRPFGNCHVATSFAVITAFALALFPGPGKQWAWDTIGTGGLILWPMFGATNQLLGGLAFMVVCFWLWRRRITLWFAIVPGIFMLVMPAWAMLTDLPRWYAEKQYLLTGIAGAMLVLEAWMIVEALLLFPKVRGVLESRPPLPGASATAQG